MRLAPFATAVAYGNRRLTRLEIGLYATGAAILLACEFELDDWKLIDDSPDQAALLLLGDLQPLEWVFVARALSVFLDEGKQALATCGLTTEQQLVLEDWMSHRTDFVPYGEPN